MNKFLPPCQNLEKTSDKIQKKCLDRWKKVWKGQTNPILKDPCDYRCRSKN